MIAANNLKPLKRGRPDVVLPVAEQQPQMKRQKEQKLNDMLPPGFDTDPLDISDHMLPPGFDPDPLDDTDIFSLEDEQAEPLRESSQPGKAADSEPLSEQDSMLHTSCKSSHHQGC
jgi:hypothetical protein